MPAARHRNGEIARAAGDIERAHTARKFESGDESFGSALGIPGDLAEIAGHPRGTDRRVRDLIDRRSGRTDSSPFAILVVVESAYAEESCQAELLRD